MAAAKKCDICGTLYEYKRRYDNTAEPINGIALVHNYNEGGSYCIYDRLDCCPNCTGSIQRLLKSLGYEEE